MGLNFLLLACMAILTAMIINIMVEILFGARKSLDMSGDL
jgi:hypothetical protein